MNTVALSCLLKRNRRYETQERKSEAQPQHLAPAGAAEEPCYRFSGSRPPDDDPAESQGGAASRGKDDYSRQAGQSSCPPAGAVVPPAGSDREESLRYDCSSFRRPQGGL